MPTQRPTRGPLAEGPEDLDRLLDRFERAWQKGVVPAIEEFVPAGIARGRQLLFELVMVDLEYRWRRPPTPVVAGAKRGAAWPARPRLEDYVERLPRLGPLHQLPVEVVGEEYRVRQRWGDRPGHAEYARRFPRHGSALRAALERIDADLPPEPATECVRPRRAAQPRARTLELRCPHCHHPIAIATGAVPQHLACPACGDTFSVEALSKARGPAVPPPLRRLGRYELGELLGMGGFGSVWRARDTRLGREVAVKLPRSGQFASPAEEERFLREARSAAGLSHPGIVAVHDVGREGDTLYIVSELVCGVNLAQWLQRRRLSFVEAAHLVAQVADALDHAHRQGVVHRDVKPSNILLEVDEGTAGDAWATRRPRVMDFGLALRDACEVTMTLDGQLLGTPAYMAPEQVRNPHAVDGRSDVYSLGVVLYELFTGELPFRGLTRMVLVQVVSEEPRPPRQLNDRIPRDLETICLKCLAKLPGQRYSTAAALAADLRRWLAGEPVHARRVGQAERLWLWTRRNPALVVTGALAALAVVAATGAPVAAVLVAAAAASLLFALHKGRAAANLVLAVEAARQHQQKTAAGLQFAVEHCALARDERDQAVAAQARASRRFAHLRELARAVLFDLPDRLGDPSGPAPARALVVRAALAYVDGLAREAGDDPVLLREAAVIYARLGDVQATPIHGNKGDVEAALASHRRSLEVFEALARSHPDNAQAQRDLAVSRARVVELRRALRKTRLDGFLLRPDSDAAG
jgi:tRNA A-37 threonylcarbamoyl transferase component Bud32